MTGTLYLVATPIGNYEDITLRALKVLNDVDVVVCEELKEGRKLLRQYGIQKPLESLSEHNEQQQTPQVLEHLREGRDIALVSDCGTPVFSDPGLLLVQQAIASHIRVVPVPGASSLTAALVVSGFPIDKFVFYGLLSPKRDIRRKELRQLKTEHRTTVLLDAPYRLLPLLEDIAAVLGPDREACVAYDLTMPTEDIQRGTAKEMLDYWKANNRKGEFVLVLKGAE